MAPITLRVSEVIARYGGFAARLMGDGVLAYFGYPQAHEDDAERAVRAGLARSSTPSQRWGLADPLQVRIGIATGLVVVGDLIGEGAAQEQTTYWRHAEPGAVANRGGTEHGDRCDRTPAADRQFVPASRHGAADAKGFAGDQRAWRVAGRAAKPAGLLPCGPSRHRLSAVPKS